MNYTERNQSLRNHTQRFAYLTLCGRFIINAPKGEYVNYFDVVYKTLHVKQI